MNLTLDHVPPCAPCAHWHMGKSLQAMDNHVMHTGYAAPSFGLHCAQLAGLRPDLVQRARQVGLKLI